MKHATPAALKGLAPLLARLRTLPNLKEKSPGVFYLKSQAFLHFHEDPAGMFADLRVGHDWRRMKVDDAKQQDALLAAARKLLPA